MDAAIIVLHYPNMNAIPTYALYGEQESTQDWLHWETIQSRSKVHGYRIAPHRHEQFFQVLHLTGGWAGVTLDGEEIDIRGSGVVVVPALTVHGYAFSDDVDGIVVTLREPDLAGRGLDVPRAMSVAGDVRAVGDALDRLIGEADRPGAAHDVAMGAHLTLLMVELLRAGQEADRDRRPADRAVIHARAFRYLVDRQFRQTRRLSDYADVLRISPTHLNRVSRQVLGASALEVIERRVALEARRMLLFSSLSIKEIGAQLGYEDPAYFTRVVVRWLGRPPASFRQEERQRLEQRSE
jgi:AraC family transcriptional activator of pobA